MSELKAQTTETEGRNGATLAVDRLFNFISGLLSPTGCECVQIEVLSSRQKILRVFIDRTDGAPVGVEDCVAVTRLLDEPLETAVEIKEVFKDAPYDLEVSSPGVDRPLRRVKDFARYQGKETRIHTFRPLTVEEAGNADYVAKNPRQKNFLGAIAGIQGEEPGSTLVELQIGAVKVGIPLRLISKANLEPKFDFDRSES
mgnify:CR=1 FL=1